VAFAGAFEHHSGDNCRQREQPGPVERRHGGAGESAGNSGREDVRGCWENADSGCTQAEDRRHAPFRSEAGAQQNGNGGKKRQEVSGQFVRGCGEEQESKAAYSSQQSQARIRIQRAAEDRYESRRPRQQARAEDRHKEPDGLTMLQRI
jgi:hypothetical protein